MAGNEYQNGVNRAALIALAAGVLAALSGLVIPVLRPLYDYAWFVGFAVAGLFIALQRERI